MSYFSGFPVIVYPLIQDGITTPYTITDIMTRVKIDMPENDFLLMTFDYQIQEGDTIEAVANKFYGTPHYHWVIMLTNNMYDYIDSWYKTEEQVYQYCIDKYGEESANSVVYVVDDYGNKISNADPRLATFKASSAYDHVKYDGSHQTITNYQHELALNEQKRNIKIVKPEFVNQFVKKFNVQLAKAVI